MEIYIAPIHVNMLPGAEQLKEEKKPIKIHTIKTPKRKYIKHVVNAEFVHNNQ